MSCFNKLLSLAIGFFFVQTLQAQDHNNAWFRTTLSVPIQKKFKIDNEFQHRRQNGLDNTNLFDKNLMFSYRLWAHYQHNEGVKFSVSPFAYFSNNRIIQKELDETAKPNIEKRLTAAIELQHEIFDQLYIVNRTAAEYRIFSKQSDITRLRNRIGFRYNLTENTKLSIFDELLVNGTGATNEHFFDQNRIGLNVEYKVSPQIKVDIGYMHITRLPITSTTKIKDNNFIFNLAYQLFK